MKKEPQCSFFYCVFLLIMFVVYLFTFSTSCFSLLPITVFNSI